jgi:UDP-N-acetylmuramoylalanine--D-glutamate ligase
MSTLILGYGKTGRAVYDYIESGVAGNGCFSSAEKNGLKLIYDDSAENISFNDNNSIFFNKSNIDTLLCEYLSGITECIASPGIERNHKIIIELKRHNIPVYGEIEFAYSKLKKGSKIIGITGTNGKTTTVTLCKSAVDKAGLNGKTFVGGNLGVPFISGIKDYEDYILEISSFQLEWIYNFKPDIAVLLNVEDDHLDRYEDFDEYRLTKYKLFKNLRYSDIAVLNYGDRNSSILKGVTGSNSVFYGFDENKCDVYYKNDALNLRLKDICGFNSSISLKNIKDTRKFVLEDMMAAACSMILYGIEPDDIQSAFEEYRLLSHRVEYIGNIGNIEFYDDSKATNPAAVLSALKTFTGENGRTAEGRNIVLILGGKDKGFNYELIVKPVKDAVKACVLIGETKNILAGVLHEHIDLIDADEMDDAVKKSFDYLRNEIRQDGSGVVLLSPASSSFDMFRDYNERGDIFKKCFLDLKENLKENSKG